MTDTRHALRSVARTPVLAAVVILSLGVGIGVNTVVFSWIQALVFRPLPGVADASAFYLIEPRGEAGSRPGTSWLEYQDLKTQIRSLPDLLAFRMVPLNVGEASRTERTYGLLVSGNYFPVLGLQPALGRLLRPEDAARPGDAPVVVISYDYWQTRFGGAAGAIGQTLRVNDREMVVVGITPEGFQGTVVSLQFDLWVPATMAPMLFAGSRELDDRSLRGYSVMGRLPAGVALERAQTEVDGAMRQLGQSYPETNATIQARVLPYWRAFRGPLGMLLQAIAILQMVMLLLLLAVCGNTANLLLARASARRREIGVRLAMGARPWRVVRLLLAENLVLGVAGAALGAAIAFWGSEALRAMPLFTTAVPVKLHTSLNGGGLAFAMLLGVLCAIAFGAAPAVHLARLDPHLVLRSGSAMAPRSRLRNALMAIEVALAMVVLIVAGLFFQSFRESRTTDPGFRREGVLLAAYDLTGRGIDGAGARLFAAQLLVQLRSMPDVEAASIAMSVPLDIHGLPLRSFGLEGRARTDGAPDRALSNTVTAGYFETMGIPFVAGADFVDLSDTAMAPQAIVNVEFVRRYLDNAEPLGRRIDVGSRTYTIAGVVRNSLYEAFGEGARPIVYLSYRDRPSLQGEIHLRTRAGGETLLAPAVRRAVRAVDQALPVYNIRTMTEHVEMNLVLRRIPARMFVVLGPLLLVLAAIGIYAVVSYTVAHRTSEIGIRIALGATAERVVSQIVRESLRVVLAGAAVGWTIVYAVYIHLVPGQPIGAAAFLGVPLLLLVVATLACWLPARRASEVDPVVALRQE